MQGWIIFLEKIPAGFYWQLPGFVQIPVKTHPGCTASWMAP